MRDQQRLVALASTLWVMAALVLVMGTQTSSLFVRLLWYPAALIAIVTPLALLMLIMRLYEEVAKLRDLTAREALERRLPQPKIRPAEPADKRPAQPQPKPAKPVTPATATDSQSDLPFGETLPRAVQTLPAEELIVAINFPSDQTDAAGIRAMRQALADPVYGQLVLSCQDILTLLGEDGIYMDQNAGRTVKPWHWRRFVEGIRGPEVEELTRIGSDELTQHLVRRVREDTIFRDAVQHFLRLFDRMLAALVPTLSDGALDRLTETRSARAFMLLGAAMNIFG